MRLVAGAGSETEGACWMDESVLSRFWPKVDKGANPTSCWMWKASRTPEGYGQLSRRGSHRPFHAHRLAWQIANRSEIPSGLMVLHRCNVPACVNPHHLYVGTRSDNLRDCIGAGTHPQARKTTCPRGHSYDGAYRRRRICMTCQRDQKRRATAKYCSLHAERHKESNRRWWETKGKDRRRLQKA